MTTALADLTDLFWDKVTTDGDCWAWTGAKNSNGYGQWAIDGVSRSVHRLTFEAFVTEIPDSLVLDHICRNRACCNPYHLEPVTGLENFMRGEMGARAAKTHCIRGHELSGANLLPPHPKRNGVRSCRACHNLLRRAARAASAAARIPVAS